MKTFKFQTIERFVNHKRQRSAEKSVSVIPIIASCCFVAMIVYTANNQPTSQHSRSTKSRVVEGSHVDGNSIGDEATWKAWSEALTTASQKWQKVCPACDVERVKLSAGAGACGKDAIACVDKVGSEHIYVATKG